MWPHSSGQMVVNHKLPYKEIIVGILLISCGVAFKTKVNTHFWMCYGLEKSNGIIILEDDHQATVYKGLQAV